MVEIRQVSPTDVGAVHRLWTDRVWEVPATTVAEWYEAAPELFVGAYRPDDEGSPSGGSVDPAVGATSSTAEGPGALVGFAAGRRHADGAELKAIGVRESHRRRGIGSRLLSAFEAAAADLGIRRVSVGSAGGYVDEFYLANGYEATKVLVRPDCDPEDVPDRGFETVVETAPDGSRNLYVPVKAHDHGFLDEIREAFDDPEAVYIMEKRLSV